jgi:DNA-binding CsgD family transcriptional regulator
MNPEALAIDAFATAPFLADGWDRALRLMASAVGSTRGQLLATGDRHVDFNWVTDVSPDYFADFVAIDAFRADVSYRVAAIAAPMQVTHEKHYDAVRAIHTDEDYIAHVRRFDGEDGAQVVLDNQAGRMFGLAVINARGDGRTTPKGRALLARLAPHALAAIRAQIAIESQGALLVQGSLEALGLAVMLLDKQGRVCAMTPAAERLIDGSTCQLRDRIPHLVTPALDRTFQNRIHAILAGSLDWPGDIWAHTNEGPLLVQVTRLPRVDWSLGFAAAAVTFRRPLGPDSTSPRRLAEALRLTVAEGEITALVAAGLSRTAIAAARATSVQTVNSQLRAIFQKCGVRREAELGALAGRIIGLR